MCACRILVASNLDMRLEILLAIWQSGSSTSGIPRFCSPSSWYEFFIKEIESLKFKLDPFSWYTIMLKLPCTCIWAPFSSYDLKRNRCHSASINVKKSMLQHSKEVIRNRISSCRIWRPLHKLGDNIAILAYPVLSSSIRAKVASFVGFFSCC